MYVMLFRPLPNSVAVSYYNWNSKELRSTQRVLVSHFCWILVPHQPNHQQQLTVRLEEGRWTLQAGVLEANKLSGLRVFQGQKGDDVFVLFNCV